MRSCFCALFFGFTLLFLSPSAVYSFYTITYSPDNGTPAVANSENIEYVYKEVGTSSRTFSSERYTIFSQMAQNGFNIEVTNKSASPITIDWNRASIIEVGGNAERIVTGETSYASRFNPIPPAFIPPHSSKTTTLVPLKNIVSVGPYGVHIEPLINWPLKMGLLGPTAIETNKKSKIYRKFINSYNGIRLGVYFPMVVENQEKNISIFYKFDFTEEIESIARMESIKNQDSEEAAAIEKPILGLIFGGKTNEGTFPIENVAPGSLADKARLSKGDLIIEVDGRSLNSYDSQGLTSYLSKKISDGSSVFLTFSRNGNKDIAIIKANK